MMAQRASVARARPPGSTWASVQQAADTGLHFNISELKPTVTPRLHKQPTRSTFPSNLTSWKPGGKWSS